MKTWTKRISGFLLSVQQELHIPDNNTCPTKTTSGEVGAICERIKNNQLVPYFSLHWHVWAKNPSLLSRE